MWEGLSFLGLIIGLWIASRGEYISFGRSFDHMQPRPKSLAEREAEKEHLQYLQESAERSRNYLQENQEKIDNWDGESRLIFHGSCLVCLIPDEERVDYCKGCTMFDWNRGQDLGVYPEDHWLNEKNEIA